MRGLRSPYEMSTTRFTRRDDERDEHPALDDGVIAVLDRRLGHVPIGPREDGLREDRPRRRSTWRPTIVEIGSIAFRSTCRESTARFEMPVARAVRT